VGGSVAHGDPSAEIPLAVTVLGAEIVFVDDDGEEERLEPEDFFLGPMLTAAPMGGLLTRLVFPVPDSRADRAPGSARSPRGAATMPSPRRGRRWC
jgi:CO/xanthine dehydrogenase FAD-binding subunit